MSKINSRNLDVANSFSHMTTRQLNKEINKEVSNLSQQMDIALKSGKHAHEVPLGAMENIGALCEAAQKKAAADPSLKSFLRHLKSNKKDRVSLERASASLAKTIAQLKSRGMKSQGNPPAFPGKNVWDALATPSAALPTMLDGRADARLMNRVQAEAHLRGRNVGSCVVRPASTGIDRIAVSVRRATDEIHHFELSKTPNGKFQCDNGRSFKTLDGAVLGILHASRDDFYDFSRTEAEAQLVDKAPGTYLLRPSSRGLPFIALSLVYGKGKVSHSSMKLAPPGVIIGGRPFDSIDAGIVAMPRPAIHNYDRQVILDLGSGNSAKGIVDKESKRNGQIATIDLKLPDASLKALEGLKGLTPKSRIFIVGHGGTRHNYIESDFDVKYSAEKYADMIAQANPQLRGVSSENGERLKVSLVACLAGVGGNESFAAKLSQALHARGIDADVVGRMGRVGRFIPSKGKAYRKLVDGEHKGLGSKVSYHTDENGVHPTLVAYGNANEADIALHYHRRNLKYQAVPQMRALQKPGDGCMIPIEEYSDQYNLTFKDEHGSDVTVKVMATANGVQFGNEIYGGFEEGLEALGVNHLIWA